MEGVKDDKIVTTCGSFDGYWALVDPNTSPLLIPAKQLN